MKKKKKAKKEIKFPKDIKELIGDESKMEMYEFFDEHPLQSNTQTINHSPERFILDFKGTYPQFGQNGPVMMVTHKMIMLDPYLAKGLLNMLSVNLRKYEEKFGKIIVPDGILNINKEMGKIVDKMSKEGTKLDNKPKIDYMG